MLYPAELRGRRCFPRVSANRPQGSSGTKRSRAAHSGTKESQNRAHSLHLLFQYLGRYVGRMTPDLSIYSQIEADVLAASNAIRLEMTIEAYKQLLMDLGVPRPDNLYVGMQVGPLFQLPVRIVAGPTKEWRVVE